MNYQLYDYRKIPITKQYADFIIDEFSLTENDFGNINKNGGPVKNFDYKYIAKGGQGKVYLITLNDFNRELAIKKGKLNETEKNLLIFTSDLVNSHICPHFLLVYDIKKIKNYDYVLMEKIDGNLNLWLEKFHSDDEWFSFLFQFLIGLYVLEKYAKTYHADLKPKNILFERIFINLDNPYLKYNININEKNYIFDVPTFNILFIIGDFGHSQSLLFENNKMSSSEIENKINQKADFENIYTLTKRIKVDTIIKNYNLNTITLFLKQNNIDYQEYYNEEKTRIEKELFKYPKRIKEDLLLKSLAYFVIEKDIYSKMNIRLKSKLILPSEKIQKFILENFNGSNKIDEIILNNFDNYLFKDEKSLGKDVIDYYVL